MKQSRTLLAVAAMAFCAAFPGRALAQMNVLNKVRGQVKRAGCLHNLRQIGLLIEAYRGEHKGRMPKSLEELAKGQSKELFVCPNDPHPPLLQQRFKCSYVYVRPLPADSSGNTIVAYDHKPLNHGRVGRNCLFHDGSVRLLSEAAFQGESKKLEAHRPRRQ